MHVRCVLTNGSMMVGQIINDLPLDEMLNDDDTFIEFTRPNGSVILLNKSHIGYISEDTE